MPITDAQKIWRKSPKGRAGRRLEHKRWKQKHRRLHLAGKSRNNKTRFKRTKIWLKTLKATITCACGENDPAALDFHHRDPTEKKYSIERACKLSLTKLKAEIEKCEAMCSNCHRKGHAGRPIPAHQAFFPAVSESTV